MIHTNNLAQTLSAEKLLLDSNNGLPAHSFVSLSLQVQKKAKSKRQAMKLNRNEGMTAVGQSRRAIYLLGLANMDWSESLLWLDNNSRSELAVCRAAAAPMVAAMEEEDTAAAAAAADVNRVDGAVFWQDKHVQMELQGTPPW